jgi:hypothetical protein
MPLPSYGTNFHYRDPIKNLSDRPNGTRFGNQVSYFKPHPTEHNRDIFIRIVYPPTGAMAVGNFPILNQPTTHLSPCASKNTDLLIFQSIISSTHSLPVYTLYIY